MTFIIDYGIRNARECLEDSIRAMAAEILNPKYAATGDALQWAENAPSNVNAADDHGDDAEEFLRYVWEDGAAYLYDTTGLVAFEDGYSGGLHFLTDAELAEWQD